MTVTIGRDVFSAQK